MRKGWIAVCIGLVLGSTGFAGAQTIDMTLSHVMSDQSPYQITLNEFKRLVEERSGGTVAVDVQCCSQAGNEARAIQSIRTGVLTGGFVGAAALESVIEEYAVLSLPYVFEDQQQAYQVLQSEVGSELLSLLDGFGIHGLGFGPVNERSVGSRNNIKIEDADDLSGVKIRVVQSQSYVAAYDALGAQPTPIAFGELFMALQNNVIDAFEGSPDSIYSDRLYEVITNLSLTKVHQSVTVLIVSKSWWEQLPPEMQTLVQEAAQEAIQVGRAAHTELTEDSLAKIRDAGIEIVEPDLQGFMEKARTSWDAILASKPKAREFLPRIHGASE